MVTTVIAADQVVAETGRERHTGSLTRAGLFAHAFGGQRGRSAACTLFLH
jgi:hypothetical protein